MLLTLELMFVESFLNINNLKVELEVELLH